MLFGKEGWDTLVHCEAIKQNESELKLNENIIAMYRVVRKKSVPIFINCFHPFEIYILQIFWKINEFHQLFYKLCHFKDFLRKMGFVHECRYL